jgi:hypothetical protein
MKNPKEIEKKLEKEIEKKREKEVKEKLEKPEIKEFKEKPEKREIKEWKEIKEKPERKEFKEAIKEKVEVKEIKEFDKQIPEKGGKELVETVDPGDIFQQRSASLDAASASKPKEDELAAKQKETDKAFKEIEKVKPEKEHVEKIQKDIEKIKPEKEFIKHEIKEFKHEFPEKHHHKDFLPDKHVFENDPKGIVENPGTGPGFDPVDRRTLFTASGSPEERIKELEDAVTRLSHFIGVDLRPDLSAGALRSEEDVPANKPDEPKTDDKNKRPK